MTWVGPLSPSQSIQCQIVQVFCSLAPFWHSSDIPRFWWWLAKGQKCRVTILKFKMLPEHQGRTNQCAFLFEQRNRSSMRNWIHLGILKYESGSPINILVKTQAIAGWIWCVVIRYIKRIVTDSTAVNTGIYWITITITIVACLVED